MRWKPASLDDFKANQLMIEAIVKSMMPFEDEKPAEAVEEAEKVENYEESSPQGEGPSERKEEDYLLFEKADDPITDLKA